MMEYKEHIFTAECEACEGNPQVRPIPPCHEEIIRCRDCKKFKTDKCKCRRFLVPHPSEVDGTIVKGAMMMTNVDPNGFCAWAERDE